MNQAKPYPVYRPGVPFDTEERCTIQEWLNTDEDSAASVAFCRVAPGETTQLHKLPVTERYLIQAGAGLLELNQEDTQAVEAGDCVVIPANTPQRIKVTSSEDLVFLCVCTPRFEPHHYINLETADTQPIEDSDR